MQNSSEFQYIAIDTIHESATNPRRTFDECKLGELAESIRTNGLIQPITVRPNSEGFEIVAGARRFRAAQLAEVFSLPARIVTISDAQALEWQLVENSQRVDVHPYEEAQGPLRTGKDSRTFEYQDDRAICKVGTAAHRQDWQHSARTLKVDGTTEWEQGEHRLRMFPYCSRD